MAERKVNKVAGIFAAPIQYERNIKSLISNLKHDNIPILCIEIDKLIKLLHSKDIKSSIDKAIESQ